VCIVPVIKMAARRCAGCADCMGGGAHYIAGEPLSNTFDISNAREVRAPLPAAVRSSNALDDPRLAKVVNEVVAALKPDLLGLRKARRDLDAANARLARVRAQS